MCSIRLIFIIRVIRILILVVVLIVDLILATFIVHLLLVEQHLSRFNIGCLYDLDQVSKGLRGDLRAELLERKVRNVTKDALGLGQEGHEEIEEYVQGFSALRIGFGYRGLFGSLA